MEDQEAIRLELSSQEREKTRAFQAFMQQSHVNTAYQRASNYASAGYAQGRAWIVRNGTEAHARVPEMSAFMKRHAYKVFNEGKTFVWTHQKWVAASAVVGAILLIIDYIRRHTPQCPVVSLKSSLNVARLDISMAQQERIPPNVTLTFCVDTSGSMKTEERIGAVKRAMNSVLDNAQQVIHQTQGANIAIAVIGFDDKAKIITPMTALIAKDKTVKKQVKESVKKLQCGGSTDILAGLEAATSTMAEASSKSAHTIILLTDGDNTIVSDRLKKIQATIATKSAALLALLHKCLKGTSFFSFL